MAAVCPHCLAGLAVHTLDGTCPECGQPLALPLKSTTPIPPPLTPSGTAIQDWHLTVSVPPSAVQTQPLSGGSVYNLGSMIDEGGMAMVFEARQTTIPRTIAIKMMKPALAGDPTMRERFCSEAAVIGGLEHPNIVPVYDLGTNERGEPFYAMRCIPGKPWSRIIGELSLQENLAVLLEIAHAVAFAHSRGVVHRDLKPSNVMLGDFGEVLLIDWGIAVSCDPESRAPRLTHAIAEYGTPAYMAPEMANGDIDLIGPRSDVYLLGAILFEILTGCPPHEGKRHKEVKQNARENVIVAAEGESELMAVAMRAMATRPADRYPGAREFQDAVREVQSHAESMGFCSRALAMLERARASGSYDDFTQALFTAQEGLRLWPESLPATQAIAATREAWAACACGKGDLDLAETQIEAGGLQHTETAARIRARVEERRRAAEQMSALEDRIATEERREWQLVFEEDFSDPDVESRWIISGGQWQWRPGELEIRDGRPQIIAARLGIPGDLRLEFEARQEGELLSDLNCFLGAPADESPEHLEGNAYSFKIGAQNNCRIGLYRLGHPLFEETGSPLAGGRRFRVTAERVGPRLTLTLNGRVICDLIDPAPPAGEGRSLIGLSGWLADTRYTMVRLWRLGSPLKADLLELAEKYVARGRHETAIDIFEDAASSTTDPARQQRARAGLERARALHGLQTSLPDLQARLAQCWPGAALRIGDDGLCLSIAGLGVTDLAPLEGLPLTELDCEENRITSLAPLRGMPLRRLNCKHNLIDSLEPLRGMPLGWLNFGINRVASLEPLAGMPLARLWCFLNPASDLEPLRGMRLISLACFGNGIESLEPLRGMPLDALGCANNAIDTLEPLRGLRLQALWCSNNRLETLEPLSGMPMNCLYCSYNRLDSLKALWGMPLNTLWCESNQIGSLETLRLMTLASLRCYNNPLTSLEPLYETPPASFLYSCDSLPPEELGRAAAAWARRPEAAEHARGALALRALAEGKTDRLRALAVQHLGRRYLYMPLCVSWDEADRCCRQLGGRLAIDENFETHRCLTELVPGQDTFWVDSSDRPEDQWWLLGNPQRYQAYAWGISPGDIGYCRQAGPLERWAVKPGSTRVYPFVLEWD